MPWLPKLYLPFFRAPALKWWWSFSEGRMTSRREHWIKSQEVRESAISELCELGQGTTMLRVSLSSSVKWKNWAEWFFIPWETRETVSGWKHGYKADYEAVCWGRSPTSLGFLINWIWSCTCIVTCVHTLSHPSEPSSICLTKSDRTKMLLGSTVPEG